MFAILCRLDICLNELLFCVVNVFPCLSECVSDYFTNLIDCLLIKVFQNNIQKKFNNNKDIYYSRNENSKNSEPLKENTKNILQKINEIFASPNYVYKANVEITLKDKKINKRIIGRNKDFIITMDNMVIPINQIIDIKSTLK